MRITPIEIQQQQFKTRLLGYDTAAVDQFLEMVAEQLERVYLQNNELKESLARTTENLEFLREREKTLQQTLITAQQVVDDMRSNAQKEVDIIIAEAHVQAEHITKAANQERAEVLTQIHDLKRQKVTFELGLRALLENHINLLDMDMMQVLESEQPQLLEDIDNDEIDSEVFKGLDLE